MHGVLRWLLHGLGSAALLVAGLATSQPCHAQLDVDILLNITDGPDGLLKYEYTVDNLPSSTVPLNVLILDVADDAAVTSIQGPEGWNADYAPEEPSFQLGWASDAGEFDIGIGGQGIFSFLSPLGPGESEYFGFSFAPDGLTVLGQAFGPVDAPRVLVGDFNMDGLVNLADMDLLGTEIAQENNSPEFDLTADDLVNTDDRDAFLGIVNRINGDADFDGQVQFADFVTLSNHFGQAGLWSQGDFSTDGEVQFPDFVILSNNFGQSTQGAAAAVPEPANLLLVTLGLISLLRAARCRS